VINSSLQHFADEYEEHVRLGHCPLQDAPVAPETRPETQEEVVAS